MKKTGKLLIMVLVLVLMLTGCSSGTSSSEPAPNASVEEPAGFPDVAAPEIAIRNKMALIPEERKVKGLFLNASVKDNINLVTIGRNKKRLLLDDKKQRDTANQYVERLQIKTPSIDKRIQDLSGGNQQKAILARWLLSNPEILLLDEPTHGIDVGAKGEIYQIIRDLKKAGIGIILVSSEMPELILMSDRIAVMNNGELSGKLRKEEITEENIMMLAAGVSL